MPFRRLNQSPVYTITINERQRTLLHAALVALGHSAIGDRKIDSDEDEYHLMCGMLAELPQVEENDPGVVHGFCY